MVDQLANERRRPINRWLLVAAGALAGAMMTFGVMPGLQHLLPPGWWVLFTDGARLELDEQSNCPRLVLQRTVLRDVEARWTIQPFRLVNGEWSSAGYAERSGFLSYETSDPPEFAAPLEFWRGDQPINCRALNGTYRVEITVALLPTFFRPRPVAMISTPITYGGGNGNTVRFGISRP